MKLVDLLFEHPDDANKKYTGSKLDFEVNGRQYSYTIANILWTSMNTKVYFNETARVLTIDNEHNQKTIL